MLSETNISEPDAMSSTVGTMEMEVKYHEEMEEMEEMIEPLTIPTFSPLILAPVTYVSSSRTTICDIMCTKNTSRIYENPKSYMKGQVSLAQIPHVKPQAINGPMTGQTDFQKMKINDLNSNLMDSMLVDRAIFFQQLQDEKQDKDDMKSRAATKFIALWRGYRKRPEKHKTYVRKKKKIAVLSQNDIVDELVVLSSDLGLKPIPGLFLI